MNRSTGSLPCFALTTALLLLGTVIPGTPPVSANTIASPAIDRFPGEVLLQDGRLTARLSAVPLHRVIEEVCKLSGAVASLEIADGQEPVSVEFSQVPIAEALVKILGGNNFVFFNPPAKESGRPPQIWIYPKNQALSKLVTSQQVEATPSVLPATAPSNDSPVAETDVVALLDAAVYGEENSARLHAVNQLLAYTENDASAKTTLAQVAISDRDPQVREAAEELLQHRQNKN